MAAPVVAAEENSSSSQFSLFDREDQVLLPDQAFKLDDVVVQDKNTLQANFTVAPGHYLYRDRIKFESKDIQITEVTLPKGDIKKDTHFGETVVFHDSFTAQISLKDAPANIEKMMLQASYQGCSVKGLCYAPIHKSIEVTLARNAVKAAPTSSDKDDQVTTLLKGGKIWLIIIGFFGFGLLLALTPCVLPMIPILSGIIVGDKKYITTPPHACTLLIYHSLTCWACHSAIA